MNLQKLAEKIKAKWEHFRGYSVEDTEIILWSHEVDLNYVPARDDHTNATWIIWCLDRLEELGWRVQIVNYGQIYMVSDIKDAQGGERCAEGKTRAEAVTLALAKALGVEE
jgi:hypothetical protein